MAQKNILFITPVFPSLNGRGRNFRAFQWVWRLQQDYQIFVLCTSIYGAQDFSDDESIKKLDCKIYTCDHAYSAFRRIRNLLSLKPSTWNAIGDVINKEIEQLEIPRPDVILCFRIQNASTALHLHKFWETTEIWLDIDEVDSKVKFNIEQRMKSEGYFLKSFRERMEGVFYSLQESKLVSEFDTVFASTREEEEYLKKLNIAAKTEVFRNRLPTLEKDNEIFMQPVQTPFTFMFVGDANYFPNLDAINFLLFDIIPGLEQVAEIPFNFIIIGGEVGGRQLQQIEKYDCVTFYRDVDDLNHIYHQVNAVIVPLRAGGGSSLKFIEALKYKKPVVATPVGSRGFDVSNGVQALIGEDSTTLITHCQILMNNHEFARELSENGYWWFINNHSFDVEMAKDLEIV